MPDVVVLVYNDHASAFSLEMIPTFAIGCAESFQPADEGWGPRPVPVVQGHPELAWHIAQSTILDEFDMTIVNRMDVDHGLTVPLSLHVRPAEGVAVQGDPARRQRRPVSAADRQPLLEPRPRDPQGGRVVRRAISTSWSWAPAACRTSCRDRARGSSTASSTRAFSTSSPRIPRASSRLPHLDYVREAGSEGIELVMWLIMRGALARGRARGLSLLPRAGVEHRRRPHHSREPALTR